MAAAIIALLLSTCYHPLHGLAIAAGLAPLPHEPLSQLVIGGYTSTEVSGDWDILYYQGGNGPWIPKISGVVEGGIEPPAGCRVDQVHMVGLDDGARSAKEMLELFQHIQKANVALNGSLAFANDWNFFMKDPSSHLENLVSTGPYAGTLDAFATGVKLRTRYEHLLDQAVAHNQTAFWASDSLRVVDTAYYFGAGFFGLDNHTAGKLQIIPESADRGANTLTPGKTCLKYAHNADAYGHAYGYRKWNQWRAAYLPAIVRRLAEQNPGIAFSESEVYSMQELCGFETIAKGKSIWCDVFSHDEWESFGYARDMLHYYRWGPGNPYSASMGWLWLNATANLLLQGPTAGPLFFSFVHDGDILPMLTALDLFSYPNDIAEDLPTSHIPTNRTFRSSDIVPMGGRVIFERLACPAPRRCYDNSEYGYPNMVYCEPEGTQDYFIRININDGIVALPGCEDGPGRSCSLDDFAERVERRGKEAREFRQLCGLPKQASSRISFLHQ